MRTRMLFKSNIVYSVLDCVISFGIVVLSFLAYYGAESFAHNIVPALIYAASISFVTVIVLFLLGMYRVATTLIDLIEVIKTLGVVLLIHLFGLIAIAFISYLPSLETYFPVWVLSTFALLFVLETVRLLPRVVRILNNHFRKDNCVRTLVLGAGSTGKVVIDETRLSRKSPNKIIAMVDDDVNKIGGSLSGIPIKGPISDIAKIIDFYHIEEVIIAMSLISNERLREIIDILEKCNVRIKRMPLLSEMQGPNDKRIIDVDLDSLLSRDPIVLDNSKISKMLEDKVVLVTGAGGSIGSELVRQIVNASPKQLILFDIYENSTYDIQTELQGKIRKGILPNIDIVTLIGSTYNETRVRQILKRYKPDYIYHAAAYKHVPLMEDSPAEAIRTNVVGTYNVAKLANEFGVKKMILVSTDKAVRPTNVMGATKRFAEMIIQYFNKISKTTKYSAVRFGNVLGSNGSVIPLFEKQIQGGGPVTITDKRIIRFFMTIPEAVSLILQCGLFADGGEIFILDMGKQVKIIDLAEKLIRKAGLIPYVDIDIIETGLRPGEKLYEELLLDVKKHKKTKNNKIYIEEADNIDNNLEKDILEITKAFDLDEVLEIKKLLSTMVNTYKFENK